MQNKNVIKEGLKISELTMIFQKCNLFRMAINEHFNCIIQPYIVAKYSACALKVLKQQYLSVYVLSKCNNPFRSKFLNDWRKKHLSPLSSL